MMSILFFLPLLSGLWSENQSQWIDIIRLKLPLLFLPLGFAGKFRLNFIQWYALALVFVSCLLLSSLWTFFNYLNNSQQINESYLQAKTMITPLDDDHVRYSWLISAGILVCGYLVTISSGKIKLFLIPLNAWFFIFLHLLASRTGIVCTYVMLFMLIVWLLVRRRKWLHAIIFLIIISGTPFAAYHIFPSFRNKIDFFKYEKDFFINANYLHGGTDAMRIISIKAGWDLMNDYPLIGTGFGDLRNKTNEWYFVKYPEVKEEDKILPGSEYLNYGAACGWPGFLVFIVVMAVPFFTSMKYKLPWNMINTSMAISLISDIGLEVQFGIFIYAFFVLWFWKWFNQEII